MEDDSMFREVLEEFLRDTSDTYPSLLDDVNFATQTLTYPEAGIAESEYNSPQQPPGPLSDLPAAADLPASTPPANSGDPSPYIPATVSTFPTQHTLLELTSQHPAPLLFPAVEIIEQPANRFRFRYKSELQVKPRDQKQVSTQSKKINQGSL